MRLTRQSPWLSTAQACKLNELAPELHDISGVQSNVCDFASGCDWKWPIRPGLIPVLQPKITQAKNKPKEYPQQRETKTVAKHAMNEVCLLPRPFYSRGRACKLQSRHKHCMKKTFFQKRLRYCGQHVRSSCKGFSSQRTAVRLTLHFIYLTYIIHVFFVLYITYIFYTIF